jgi:hypothetical protein
LLVDGCRRHTFVDLIIIIIIVSIVGLVVISRDGSRSV